MGTFNNMVDPSTIKQRIQELLGATKPVEAGTVEGFLTSRFQPQNTNDSIEALKQVIQPGHGAYISGGDVANSRVADGLKTIMELQKISAQGGDPSAVREYQFYKNLPDIDKPDYLMVKRNPYLNVGDSFTRPNPTGGPAVERIPINLKPGEQPNIRGQQAEATKVGEATGAAKGAIEKKYIQAPQIEDYLQQAEKLLPSATSGGLETQWRDTNAYFGRATDASKNDSQLDVLSAALTSGVPRMEGPQSNYDVKLYEKAAGDLANSRLPVATRLAAIKTIREINNKYAAGAPASSANVQQSKVLNGITYHNINGEWVTE